MTSCMVTPAPAEEGDRLVGGGEFRERETELYGLIVMDLALRSFT
jgi:hypothetical protein